MPARLTDLIMNQYAHEPTFSVKTRLMLGIEASRVFRRLLSVRRSYHEQGKEQVFT